LRPTINSSTKYNKVEQLLLDFESLSVSQNMRETLVEYIEQPWFHGIFTGWIHRRLREGIGNVELLTLTYHFDPDRNPELGPLGALLNSVILGNVLQRKINHSHFFYLIQYDRRRKNNLLKETLRHLTHIRIGDVLPLIKQMSEVIKRPFEEMFVEHLESRKEGRSLSNMISLNALELDEQLKVIAVACKLNRVIFEDLALALDQTNLLNHAIDRAHDMGGADELSQALLVTEISIERLEKCSYLSQFLVGAAVSIRPVIKHLIGRAEFEERWNYVLKLAPAFNKKEILRILLKAKDPTIIDKFFFLYKAYPEVKNLAPFL